MQQVLVVNMLFLMKFVLLSFQGSILSVIKSKIQGKHFQLEDLDYELREDISNIGYVYYRHITLLSKEKIKCSKITCFAVLCFK